MSTSPSVGLVFSDRYLAHDTGLYLFNDQTPFPYADPVPHPSSPQLVGRAKQLIDLAGISGQMTRIEPSMATNDDLLAVHTPALLERVERTALTGGDCGEGSPIGVGGDVIARLAAGGVMAAVDAVMANAVETAYALVRPPGHHAMADRAMGFCVFNNVAVAVRHAQRNYGTKRVVIVDWDVHHGNGTQDIFYGDADVLFISLHQEDHFPPGWGKVGDTGRDEGEGFTVNIPLPAGSGNAAYAEAFDRIVLPIAAQFEPDLVMISAGQDANVVDPLARMCLTTSAYRTMTSRLLGIANTFAGGRMVIAQEGGYSATYAPYCSAAIAETLTGAVEGPLPLVEPYGERAESQPASILIGVDARAAIEAVIRTQNAYWKDLF